jgi:hypothetical protein
MMFEPLKQNCIQIVTKELEAYYRVSAAEMTRRLLDETPLSVSIQNVLTALYQVTNLYELIDVIHNQIGVELTSLHETLMAAMSMESDLPRKMVERLWDTWPSQTEIEQPALGTGGGDTDDNPFGTHQYDSPVFWLGSPAHATSDGTHTTSECSSIPEVPSEYASDPILRPSAPTPEMQAVYEVGGIDIPSTPVPVDTDGVDASYLPKSDLTRKRVPWTPTLFTHDEATVQEEYAGINYVQMLKADKTLQDVDADSHDPQFMVEV